MATYLFSWNPQRWPWQSLDDDHEFYKKRGFFDGTWSSGVTRRIKPGDRVFLIRLGRTPPVGIIASGFALTSPFPAEHFSDPDREAWYIDLRYDILLHYQKEAILDRSILAERIPSVHWSPQASGASIQPESAIILESLWTEHLRNRGLSPVTYSEEVDTPERFWEGALRRITVDAYERDPRARKACIDHYGYKCQICDFDFFTKYGDIGKDFIHVHHITPLADIGETYSVDPLKDMIPVCPNCHAMLHRKREVMSTETLKQQIHS